MFFDKTVSLLILFMLKVAPQQWIKEFQQASIVYQCLCEIFSKKITNLLVIVLKLIDLVLYAIITIYLLIFLKQQMVPDHLRGIMRAGYWENKVIFLVTLTFFAPYCDICVYFFSAISLMTGS